MTGHAMCAPRPFQQRHRVSCDSTNIYKVATPCWQVDAAVKIQRVWTVPADERLIPASDASRDLPAKEEAELRRKLHGLSETAFKELSTYLYRGLTQQLTSMPVDIRVEREIKSDHEDGQRGVRCSSNMNRQTHIS